MQARYRVLSGERLRIRFEKLHYSEKLSAVVVWGGGGHSGASVSIVSLPGKTL